MRPGESPASSASHSCQTPPSPLAGGAIAGSMSHESVTTGSTTSFEPGGTWASSHERVWVRVSARELSTSLWML